MPGAYVAKPEVVTPPDVPDGWNPDWPFGDDGEGGWYPFPPGYTPVYSLNLSASASMSYDGAASSTVSLRDHVDHGTARPSGCSVTWTATIGGEAINLRFSGETSYASSIVSSYGDIGDYWGAAPEIEFELTEENDGDTVVLLASSTVFGNAVFNTCEINVTVIVLYSISITLQVTSNTYNSEDEQTGGCILLSLCRYEPELLEYIYGQLWLAEGGDDTSSVYSPYLPELTPSVNEGTNAVVIESDELNEDTVYRFTGYAASSWSACTASLHIVITNNSTEEVVIDYNEVLSAPYPNFGDTYAFLFDTAAGELTVAEFDLW